MNKQSQSDILRDVPYDLRIEIIENEFRKDFTESEKADFAERIRPYLKEQTNQGMRTDLNKPTLQHLEKISPESVNEKIGKILRESGETVRKRAKVFEDIDSDTRQSLDTKKKSLHSAYTKSVATENAKKPVQLLPNGKFNHIVEDPGWDFGNKNVGGAGKSGASYHYKTEPTGTIARIPVHTIAADNSILYMWSTNQHLITGSMLMSEYYKILNEQKLEISCKKITNPDKIKKLQEQCTTDNESLADILKGQKVQSDALSVMYCHGFTPKSIITWEKEDKKGWGGYWLNNVTEHLLVGIRGEVTPFGLSENTLVKSKYMPKSHSKKPDEMWRLIEKCVDTQRWNHRKIELNCRSPRKGWHPHGDQITSSDIASWMKLK